MKTYHGITELQHLIDLRRTVLLKDVYAEYQKEHQQYYYNRAWTKNGGLMCYGMLLQSAKCSRPPDRRKTLYERRIGEPCKGPVIPFWAMVECYPISSRDQSRLHQFGKKVQPGIFLGYELIAEGIWKGDILVADLEELGKMDASEIHPRRINAKEVLTPPRRDEIFFPSADGAAKLSERDQEFREPTVRQHRLVWSEDLSGELQGESEGFHATETNSKIISEPPGIGKPLRGAESNAQQDGADALNDFWSIRGDFIYRHPIKPRVQFYVPKEERSPIPLIYILALPGLLT